MIDPSILQRKGPRKLADIDPEVLKLLEQGRIETVNLTEWLGMDHRALIDHVFPELGWQAWITPLNQGIDGLKKPTTMQVIRTVGETLYSLLQDTQQVIDTYALLSTHPSDSIRCYAPYVLAHHPDWTLAELLERVPPSAADPHFGVREVAWMAVRPRLDQHLKEALTLLQSWVLHEDENIRRFASEATRPRGVWCNHIEALKEEPEQALPLLEPLKSDPSRYVQNSVANWLNDASKTRPDFVQETCERWTAESPTGETKYIVQRSLRTLTKAGKA